MGFITSDPMPVSHKVGINLARTAQTVISFGGQPNESGLCRAQKSLTLTSYFHQKPFDCPTDNGRLRFVSLWLWAGLIGHHAAHASRALHHVHHVRACVRMVIHRIQQFLCLTQGGAHSCGVIRLLRCFYILLDLVVGRHHRPHHRLHFATAVPHHLPHRHHLSALHLAILYPLRLRLAGSLTLSRNGQSQRAHCNGQNGRFKKSHCVLLLKFNVGPLCCFDSRRRRAINCSSGATADMQSANCRRSTALAASSKNVLLPIILF